MTTKVHLITLLCIAALMPWNAGFAQDKPVQLKELPIQEFILLPELILKTTPRRRFQIDDFHGTILKYEIINSDIERKVLYLAQYSDVEYGYILREIYIEPDEINQLISALDLIIDEDLSARLKPGEGYSYITKDGLKIFNKKGTSDVNYFISFDPRNSRMLKKIEQGYLKLFQRWCIESQKYFNR